MKIKQLKSSAGFTLVEILVALTIFTFAVLGPIAATAVFSFFEWNGFGPFEPVGVANFLRAASDPIFRASFLHVAIYIGLTIVLEVVVGLLLAGMVTARPRGTAFFRVAFFVPVMLPMGGRGGLVGIRL